MVNSIRFRISVKALASFCFRPGYFDITMRATALGQSCCPTAYVFCVDFAVFVLSVCLVFCSIRRWNAAVCVAAVFQYPHLFHSHTVYLCISTFCRFHRVSICVAQGFPQLFMRCFRQFRSFSEISCVLRISFSVRSVICLARCRASVTLSMETVLWPPFSPTVTISRCRYYFKRAESLWQ